ncbi:tRNA lysidine(34) synthetase TilS [Billgrantia montanilacus]|uniref:tRNA(Ile)-lysidine synthase n=1 Tax=Billgrantia montanilacus TaxID=2282305 RepID=A0A368TWI9_9GAMM|nr:tRNA lysidine(34) synthetase TilS [Halomonas montanilacus]RCV89189.1 tRNA lysidine(34) synthetase TilS [Halomonas montanilacus]
MFLQLLIDDALAETPPGRVVWVALSGGLDSSLLLSLTAESCRRYPRPLYALHVHHGLQAAADDFEIHCRRLCSRLGVPLFVERVDVSLSAGLGLEGGARLARYSAFERRVACGETLWLAQHRDDQAETFLLAALRGSGVRGLAGMPTRRDARGVALERPLLDTPRSALEAHAARLGLRWIEDPSNADESLDRNFLRRNVLPLLQSRWPHTGEVLASAARQAGEADALLDELAALDLQHLGGDPGQLSVTAVRALSPPRQRLLIRHACRCLSLPTPPEARLAALMAQLSARRDARVQIGWSSGEARIWRERLYLRFPSGPLPAGWSVDWDGLSPLTTPLGRCNPTLRRRDGGPAELRLALRRGGERLRLAERGSRDLKRLLQEAELPPWERERLLVAWHGEAVVAVLQPEQGRWLAVAEGWEGAPDSGEAAQLPSLANSPSRSSMS